MSKDLSETMTENEDEVMTENTEMRVISEVYRPCICCMKEHMVKIVQVDEYTEFKDVPIDYVAEYFYCENDDSFYENGDMLSANTLRIKDEYRKKMGLLTSGEITGIRAKYGTTQKDLCALLGWGEKTITRYEGHQVQDRAHDSILKKLDQDPEWFLELLVKGKNEIPAEAYSRYFRLAAELYEKDQDLYLRRAVESKYMLMHDQPLRNGNAPIDLEKLAEVMQYFSDSREVSCLYKVKLMKLLWYSDVLAWQQRGRAITGLVYQAQPMGAVPICHDLIIYLAGINCEEIDMGDGVAYHFLPASGHEYPHLTEEEKGILDKVIAKFGKMTKDEIVEHMHQEKAYRETPLKEIISFEYANEVRF